MTYEQEQNLADIKAQASKLIDAKYRSGQKTHGGNLFDLSVSALLDEAINEAIDQLTYLITAKNNLIHFKQDHGDPGTKTNIRSVGTEADPFIY